MYVIYLLFLQFTYREVYYVFLFLLVMFSFTCLLIGSVYKNSRKFLKFKERIEIKPFIILYI